MGLFPVAMKSAQESQRETRSAHIAQQIFSDLSSMSGPDRFLVTGSDYATNRISLSLTASSTNSVYFDSSGAVLGTANSSEAIYEASVSITPNNPISELTRVQTTVSTPAAAATTNRSSYTFVTLMNAQ